MANIVIYTVAIILAMTVTNANADFRDCNSICSKAPITFNQYLKLRSCQKIVLNCDPNADMSQEQEDEDY